MSGLPECAWSPCGDQLMIWCPKARHAIIAHVLTGRLVTVVAEGDILDPGPLNGEWHWASNGIYVVYMDISPRRAVATIHNAATGDTYLRFLCGSAAQGCEQFLWASRGCIVPGSGKLL